MLPYYLSLSFIFYFVFITRNVECSDLTSRREIRDGRYFDARRKIFRSTESSDFHNIIYDDTSGAIFVGAVNFIFMLDASDVRLMIGKVHWAPNDKDADMCRNFRGDDIVCKNYIRVLHSVNSTMLYACGTMAYRPVCKYINKNEFKGVQGEKAEEQNLNYLPHEPFSSIVSTMIDGTLFTATSASNGIISKTLNEATLKTNNDLFWLSDPHFVSTFNIPANDDQGKVYVLFREKAEEIPSQFFVRGDDQEDELPKLTYSRIASICTNDHGGRSYVLNNKFTTFAKLRIACPVPMKAEDKQSIPYYYDNLQSSFLVPNAEDPSNPTLYAIFTTPDGASDVTATCVFHMHDIEKALQTKKYWNAAGLDTGNLFSYYNENSGPPPGSCVKDTTTLSNAQLSFCEKHPLKVGILTPRDESAINQKSGMRFKFIIVDRIPKTERVEGKSVEREYDVVHYITENGYIHREAFSVSNRSIKWILSPKHVFQNQSSQESVKTVIKSNNNILVTTDVSVVQLPLKLCSPSEDCLECESIKDPYCDWTTTDSSHTKRHSEGKHEPGSHGTLNGKTNARESENAEEKDLNELTIEIARLNKVVKKQNETIAYLQTDFREVKHNFSLCLRDRTILRGNYSFITNKIMSFEHTKKAATRLYRDTIYALRDCQYKETEVRKQLHHEKQARNEAEQRRSDIVNKVNYTVIDCETNVRDHNPEYNGKYVTSMEVDDNESYVLSECEKDKESLKVQYSEQMKDIKANLLSSESKQLTSRKYLASCISKSAELKNRGVFIELMNRNLTRTLRTVRRYQEADRKKIQRLQWLHKKNGRRGQQDCEYANWFAYKTSNKMFHLGRDRMTYAKSIKVCNEIKAKLAVFRNEDEMRYVHNVIRSFEFSRHFWIGLVKHHNGTLTWSNGSVYLPGDIERFPSSQRNKLKNRETYCGEINSLQRWQLVPCNKTRRPLCEREYRADDRLNHTQPIIEFDYKDLE